MKNYIEVVHEYTEEDEVWVTNVREVRYAVRPTFDEFAMNRKDGTGESEQLGAPSRSGAWEIPEQRIYGQCDIDVLRKLLDAIESDFAEEADHG